MPPKPKYTKEELIKVALELTRESGIDAVVARNLGNKLSVAPSPYLLILKVWRKFDRLCWRLPVNYITAM